MECWLWRFESFSGEFLSVVQKSWCDEKNRRREQGGERYRVWMLKIVPESVSGLLRRRLLLLQSRVREEVRKFDES